MFSASLKAPFEAPESGSSDPQPDPGPVPDPSVCPYADGSKGGELYYIREVNSPGNYKVFAYRYDNSSGKFEFRGAPNFSAGGSDHKAGEWVHYHIMDGFVGVCTGDGDGAVIPEMYTVSFDMNGQTVEDPPEDQEVVEGGRVSNPGTYFPVKGYDLEGWYTEEECEYKWDFGSDTVTEDMTLYAHWTPKKMGIVFDLGGGTDGPEQFDLTYGEDFPDLKVPTKTDYHFSGFFTVDDVRITNSDGSPVSGAADLL